MTDCAEWRRGDAMDRTSLANLVAAGKYRGVRSLSGNSDFTGESADKVRWREEESGEKLQRINRLNWRSAKRPQVVIADPRLCG